MRRTLLACISALVVLGLATPAQALPFGKLVIETARKGDDTVLDERGRLPPETVYRVRLTSVATLPPMSVCPFGYVTTTFTIVERPDYSTAVLSPASVTQPIPPSGGVGFSQVSLASVASDLSLVLDKSAPKGHAGLYTVKVVAVPNQSTTGGCTIAPSDPVAVSFIVVAG